MALANMLKLIDNGLQDVFNRKPHDRTKARKPLLRGIENARKQFENGQTKAPNRWWRASNGVVALTVKQNGRILEINGVGTNHMPEERFIDFLDLMKASVEAGEFDEQLANDGKGNTDVHIGKRRTTPKPSVERPWQSRKDWSQLDAGTKKSLGRLYNGGKNPDGTLISEVGHKPDAPVAFQRR